MPDPEVVPGADPLFGRALSPADAAKLATALDVLRTRVAAGTVSVCDANKAKHIVNNAVAQTYDAVMLHRFDFRGLPPHVLRLAQRTRFPTVATLCAMLREVEAAEASHPFIETLAALLREAAPACALVRSAQRMAAKRKLS